MVNASLCKKIVEAVDPLDGKLSAYITFYALEQSVGKFHSPIKLPLRKVKSVKVE